MNNQDSIVARIGGAQTHIESAYSPATIALRREQVFENA